jgi:hypothetical protein
MYTDKRTTDAAALASSYASVGSFAAAGAVDQDRWQAMYSVAFADGTPATSQLPASVLHNATYNGSFGSTRGQISAFKTNKAVPDGD